MTDFLDQLEHDLRAAAQRRDRRRRPMLAVTIAATVGAAACLLAIGVSTINLPRERERASADTQARRDLRVTVVSTNYSPAAVLAGRLKHAGYTDRRAGVLDRDAPTDANGDLETVVLYRNDARATAADVAQRLDLPAPRPIAPSDEQRLGARARNASVVVIVGPDLEQRVLAESGDCAPAGELTTGALSLCTLDGGSSTGFVVEQGGERRVLPVDTPTATIEGGERVLRLGHWRWAAAAPDGKTIIATWSGECEVPEAFLIPADGGRPRSVTADTDPAPKSEALGWTTDGRAIVFMAADPGCGTELEPGLYLVAPNGQRTLIAATDRNAPPATLKPSLRARSEDEVRQAMP